MWIEDTHIFSSTCRTVIVQEIQWKGHYFGREGGQWRIFYYIYPYISWSEKSESPGGMRRVLSHEVAPVALVKQQTKLDVEKCL